MAIVAIVLFMAGGAAAVVPDYAVQIANQYKKPGEYFGFIETNKGIDKAYYVIVYYTYDTNNKRKITGSIIVDKVTQKPLKENEFLQSDFQNILKFSSLIWDFLYWSEDGLAIYDNRALAKSQMFYSLSVDLNNAADEIYLWIGAGAVINVVDIIGSIPEESLDPVVLALEAWDVGIFKDTQQILDIQKRMYFMLNGYRTMSTNYRNLGDLWYHVSEGEYDYADPLIPRSTGLDQTNLAVYVNNILENLKYIASQDISAYVFSWHVASPEEVEHINQVELHYLNRKNSFEELST